MTSTDVRCKSRYSDASFYDAKDKFGLTADIAIFKLQDMCFTAYKQGVCVAAAMNS